MKLAAALFGEKDNRHELLEFKGAAREVFSRISRFTDRRSAIDGSVLGFADEAYYFVLKTWHDAKATRSGFRRVLAFAIPLSEASAISNLGDVFSVFPIAPPDALSEYTVQLTEQGAIPTPLVGVLFDRLADTLEAILFDQARPVVWLDDGDFVTAISFIWALLPGSIRRKFRFRSATHPDDDVAEWDIIATAPNRSAMWRGHRIASAARLGKPRPIVEELLKGGASEIEKDLKDLGVEPQCFGDYEIVERVRSLLKGEHSSIDYAATLIRDALTLNAPASSLANAGVHALLCAVETANPDDLTLLRNLDQGFARENSQLREAVVALASSLERSNDSGLGLARNVLNRNGREWWIDAVSTGFRQFFLLPWNNAKGRIAWNLLLNEPRTISFLVAAAQESRFVPGALAEYVDGPAEPPPGDLLTALRTERWYDAHAAALSLDPDRRSALLAQVRAEPQESESGVRILAGCSDPLELLDAAVESGDPRLVRQGAEAFIRSETIVPDLHLAEWQAIVLVALGLAADGDIAHPRLDVWLHQLSEIEGQSELTSEIWRAIGRLYPQGLLRVNVPWQDVGEDTRLSVQRETASAWLLNPLEAMTQLVLAFVGVAPIRQIVTPEVLRRGDPDAALALFESNQYPDEELFLAVLSNVLGQGGVARYARVRSLIVRNSWRRAAAEFADRVPANELSPQLIALLKRRQRVRLAAATDRAGELVPDTEWWGELTRVAIELFPSGVCDRDVFERSGGSLSDINLHAPGSEQWYSAISTIRRGGLAISVDSLLEGMLDLYGRNAELRQLREIARRKGLL